MISQGAMFTVQNNSRIPIKQNLSITKFKPDLLPEIGACFKEQLHLQCTMVMVGTDGDHTVATVTEATVVDMEDGDTEAMVLTMADTATAGMEVMAMVDIPLWEAGAMVVMATAGEAMDADGIDTDMDIHTVVVTMADMEDMVHGVVAMAVTDGVVVIITVAFSTTTVVHLLVMVALLKSTGEISCSR